VESKPNIRRRNAIAVPGQSQTRVSKAGAHPAPVKNQFGLLAGSLANERAAQADAGSFSLRDQSLQGRRTAPELLAKSTLWAQYCDAERSLEKAIRRLTGRRAA
jgi:hypothetical protein